MAHSAILSPNGTRDLRWLLTYAVVVPAVITALDFGAIYHAQRAQGDLLAVVIQLGWYVAQVALIGQLVARGTVHPLLRWVVFGWALLLVNLLTLSVTVDFTRVPLSATLFAGETGLCVVWMALGDGRWQVRWPLATLSIFVIIWVWSTFAVDSVRRSWTELIVLQTITLAVVCAVLRLRGFQLQNCNLAPTKSQVWSRDRVQFGTRHVMIWTAALAILLGIAKTFDPTIWRYPPIFLRGGLFWLLVVAAAFAIVMIVSLWIALGHGRAFVRYPCGAACVSLVGLGVALWSKHSIAVLQTPGRVWRLRDSILWHWYEVGWMWLAWMVLSGAFFVATLLIFHNLGYRIARSVEDYRQIR